MTVQNETGSEFSLNEKSVCFMCLEESSTPKTKTCIKSVFRYLKINAKQVFTSSCVDNNGDDGDGCTRKDNNDGSLLLWQREKVPNYSVWLCNHCSIITTSLSNLCLQLELLQMRVGNCLQSVLAALEKSTTDNDSTSMVAFEKKGKNDLLQCTKLLRKEMTRKCHDCLNRSLPKVELVNDPGILISRKTCEMVKVEPLSNPSSPSGVESEGGEISDTESEQCEADSLSESKTSLEDSDPLCKWCDLPRIISSSCRQRHQIMNHIEHWFHSSKVSNLSMTEFKRYCNHVMEVEVISAEKVLDSTGKATRGKCPFCPHTATTKSNMRNLRQHVCSIHKEDIASKLVELQRTTPLSQLKEMTLVQSSRKLTPEERRQLNSNTTTCDVCGKRFNSSKNLFRHVRFVHKKTTMGSVADVFPFQCDICGKGFKFSYNIKRHKEKMHPHNVSLINCDICGKGAPDYSSLWKHKEMEHGERKPLPRCDICGKSFKQGPSLCRHKKLVHGSLSGYVLKSKGTMSPGGGSSVVTSTRVQKVGHSSDLPASKEKRLSGENGEINDHGHPEATSDQMEMEEVVIVKEEILSAAITQEFSCEIANDLHNLDYDLSTAEQIW